MKYEHRREILFIYCYRYIKYENYDKYILLFNSINI